MNEDKINDAPENSDEEYIGNIWGWKFSFISLGIIVAMLLLMWYRYTTIITHPSDSESQTITIEKDSSQLRNQSID